MAEAIMKNVSITTKTVKCSISYILRFSSNLLRDVYVATVPDTSRTDYLNNIYFGASDTEPTSFLEIASDDGDAIQLFKDDSLDVLNKLIDSNDFHNSTSILKIDDYGDGHQYKDQKHFPLRKKEYSLPDVFHFRTIEEMPPASLDIIDVMLFDRSSISPTRLIRLTFKDMPKKFFDKLEEYKASDDDLGDSYTISASP